MKMPRFTAALLFIGASAAVVPAAAHADAPPPRSGDYAGNHRTLVEDQKASPQAADCIASGYDYVKGSRAYDRLGFTRGDIAAAAVTDNGGKAFGTADTRPVSTVLTVSGEARGRSVDARWAAVTLRCGFADGTLHAIELVPAPAGN